MELSVLGSLAVAGFEHAAWLSPVDARPVRLRAAVDIRVILD
jgi:hypothetical protein